MASVDAFLKKDPPPTGLDAEGRRAVEALEQYEPADLRKELFR